ncbi:hypothetical protein [Methylophaga lonarensis]|uniref:hypothetical protein n=1 Tax=Methylophaga lonarensis TaxID=999151 RepID=UPI003D278394
MTVPLLPFGLITTFGCPWHGLVKNGELTLPNSETLAWPQPSNGDSVLVRFPAAPGAGRTPEQAADDVVQGKEWRTEAIIAGADQLYGKPIGSKWLHRDNIGRVWRVTWFASGSTFNLTLSDFGRIGIDLPVRTPVLTTASVSGSGLSTINSVQLMDVRPDGRQALFKANGPSSTTAFIAINLSGDNVATATVVRAAGDMADSDLPAEVVTGTPITQSSTPSYYRANAAQQNDGFVEWQPTPFGAQSPPFFTSADTEFSLSYENGNETKSQEGSVQVYFWAFYDRDGAIRQLSVKKEFFRSIVDERNGSGSADFYAYADAIPSGSSPPYPSGYMTGSITTTQTNSTVIFISYKYTLLRDETEIDSYEVTGETISSTVTSAIIEDAQPLYDVADVGEFDFNRQIPPGAPANGFVSGFSSSSSGSSTNEWVFDADGVLDLDDTVTYGGSYYNMDEVVAFNSATSSIPSFNIQQRTNKLACVSTQFKYKAGFLLGWHVSPENQNATRTETLDPGSLYAAFDPVTLQIIRDQDSPVAFV